MILITKGNVTVELLNTLVGVSKKFRLLTRKGVQVAEIVRSTVITRQDDFFIRHVPHSPYAITRRGTNCTYLSGSIVELVDLLKKEEYGFYIREDY